MEFLSIAFSMRLSIRFNSVGLRKSDSVFLLLQLKIKKTVKTFLERNPKDEFLQSISSEKINGLLIDKAFDAGNKLAQQIYEYTGTQLGLGLAQAANLLSPEAFIFYGGFSNAGRRILDPAKISMEKYSIK